ITRAIDVGRGAGATTSTAGRRAPSRIAKRIASDAAARVPAAEITRIARGGGLDPFVIVIRASSRGGRAGSGSRVEASGLRSLGGMGGASCSTAGGAGGRGLSGGGEGAETELLPPRAARTAAAAHSCRDESVGAASTGRGAGCAAAASFAG